MARASRAPRPDSFVSVQTVQNRGADVIRARKLSSAQSAAKAIADHMHDWWAGTPEGAIVSMTVRSDGAYQVPAGLFFSFPVTIQPGGKWHVVQDLPLEPFDVEKIRITMQELLEEKAEAFDFFKGNL